MALAEKLGHSYDRYNIQNKILKGNFGTIQYTHRCWARRWDLTTLVQHSQ